MTAAPVVKPRTKAGSFASFERRYQPVLSADKVFLRDWQNIPKETDAHFVWTAVDCDGRLYLVPGFATVNYFARVLCAVPWGESEERNPGYVY